jgi:hypothetical protein
VQLDFFRKVDSVPPRPVVAPGQNQTPAVGAPVPVPRVLPICQGGVAYRYRKAVTRSHERRRRDMMSVKSVARVGCWFRYGCCNTCRGTATACDFQSHA